MTTGSIDFDAKARTWDEDEAKCRRAERVAGPRVFPVFLATAFAWGAGAGP